MHGLVDLKHNIVLLKKIPETIIRFAGAVNKFSPRKSRDSEKSIYVVTDDKEIRCVKTECKSPYPSPCT